ncbi:hypothetical protein CKA32_003489 [Geitlerinema sp. FC II]|nr:hypothetical protein CKA32_003489 [Geitlerinema sp. FC II]
MILGAIAFFRSSKIGMLLTSAGRYAFQQPTVFGVRGYSVLGLFH